MFYATTYGKPPFIDTDNCKGAQGRSSCCTGFLVGAVLPIIPWLLSRRYPKSFWKVSGHDLCALRIYCCRAHSISCTAVRARSCNGPHTPPRRPSGLRADNYRSAFSGDESQSVWRVRKCVSFTSSRPIEMDPSPQVLHAGPAVAGPLFHGLRQASLASLVSSLFIPKSKSLILDNVWIRWMKVGLSCEATQASEHGALELTASIPCAVQLRRVSSHTYWSRKPLLTFLVPGDSARRRSTRRWL